MADCENMEYAERIAVWDPWFGILSHRNRGKDGDARGANVVV